jgi:small subunit ribosomal protein S4e
MVILRDKLMITANRNEAKKALKTGKIEVNGKIVRSEKFPVGLGDIVRIALTGESYRVSIAKGAVIKLDKLHAKDTDRTLKVIGKYLAAGKKTMFRLHDGSAVNAGKEEARVNDSVVLSGAKIKDVLKFEKGAKCFVIKGAHASQGGTVSEIKKGSATSNAMVKIDGDGGSFETIVDNVMVVGA